jgi:hypothetical protein
LVYLARGITTFGEIESLVPNIRLDSIKYLDETISICQQYGDYLYDFWITAY